MRAGGAGCPPAHLISRPIARRSGCSGRTRGGGSGRLATARCKHPLGHDGAADAASLLDVTAVLVEGRGNVRVASRGRVLPTFVVVMGMLLIFYKETTELLVNTGARSV